MEFILFYIFVFVLSNSSCWLKYHQLCIHSGQMTTQHETNWLKYTQQNKQTNRKQLTVAGTKKQLRSWCYLFPIKTKVLLLLCTFWLRNKGSTCFFLSPCKNQWLDTTKNTPSNKKKHKKKVKTTAADIIFCKTKQLKWFLSSLFCVKTMFLDLVPQTII